jgi:hypothetical protein
MPTRREALRGEMRHAPDGGNMVDGPFRCMLSVVANAQMVAMTRGHAFTIAILLFGLFCTRLSTSGNNGCFSGTGQITVFDV